MFSRSVSLWLVLLIVGCSSLMCADVIPPCSSASLAQYEVSGFDCAQNKVIYSNFTFSSTASGNATQLSVGDVTVFPIGNGFLFVGSFSAGGGNAYEICLNGPASACLATAGTQITTIGYTAKGPLTGATLCCAGFPSDEFAEGSSAGVQETLCLAQGTCISLSIYNAANTLRPIAFPDCNGIACATFLPQNLLNITETLNLYADPGNVAEFGSITNGFSTPPVPEPASSLLVLSGFAAMAAMLKRRTTHS